MKKQNEEEIGWFLSGSWATGIGEALHRIIPDSFATIKWFVWLFIGTFLAIFVVMAGLGYLHAGLSTGLLVRCGEFALLICLLGGIVLFLAWFAEQE